MVESVSLMLNPNAINQPFADPKIPSAPINHNPFDENLFESTPLDDPACAPCPIKFKRGVLAPARDYNLPFSTIIGTKALESAFHPYTVRIAQRMNPKSPNLSGVPQNSIRIMQAIDHRNGMPIQNGNRVIIFHKRFGLNPKMREVLPESALIELKECRYVKASLAIFRDHSDGGFDNLLALNVLPEYSYRLDSLNDLSQWYSTVGIPFILGHEF